MATPITHIVLANKLYDRFFADKDKQNFLIGTSFPDIRYLGSIDRGQTHLDVTNIKEIINDDAFMAGVKLHSYIDQSREEFITNRGIYDLYPPSGNTYTAIKLTEDEFLYDQITDWNLIISYFDTILDEEIEFGVPKEDIKKWHQLLQHLFKQKPNNQSVQAFSIGLGGALEDTHSMSVQMDKMRQDGKVQEIILDYYNQLPELISS